MDEFKRKINKIKMYSFVALAILLLVSALAFIGQPYSSMSFSAGGKAGFFIVIMAVLNAIFYPLLGKHALTGGFITLSFIASAVSYYYYKRLKS